MEATEHSRFVGVVVEWVEPKVEGAADIKSPDSFLFSVTAPFEQVLLP